MKIHVNRRNSLIRVLFRAFIFLAVHSAAAATANAQNAHSDRIILPAREATVRIALGEIQRQSAYRIAVNWQFLDPESKVFFAASSLTVNEIMMQVLAGTNLKWQTMGKQIVISPEKDTSDEPQPALYSAMSRKNLPQQMTIVNDPRSESRISPDEIARIRSGYWRSADEGKGSDSLSLAVVNFRVNKTRLERDYMNNAHTLDMIHRTFSDREVLASMDFITVTAAASPEGNTKANAKLAAERALAAKSYLMWKYPFMDRNRIFTFSIGEDWTGLYKMVNDDPQTPRRNEVLDILGSDADSDTKRARLKQLDRGRAYRYIASNMLPYLRGAAACMIYYKEKPDPVVLTDTVYVDRLVEVEKVVEKIVEKVVEKVPEKEKPVFTVFEPEQGRKRYFFAVKTNLLYDIALLPDLALEFPLPRRWSIEAGGQWSWWNSEDPKHYYHRIQSAGVEVRKWFGRNGRRPLSGHFLGVYGMGGNYDIKFGERGVLCDGMSWSAGVTYGYSTPIGRRLNLEFSLGVGYLWGEYKKYTWNPEYRCYPWEGTYQRNYIGPTKAEISLVWLIGGGLGRGNNSIGNR